MICVTRKRNGQTLEQLRCTSMRAVAIKKGQDLGQTFGFQAMGSIPV